MILDKITNLEIYKDINKYIPLIAEFVEKTDLLALEEGKGTIEEDKVFYIVQNKYTKDYDNNKWEAHKKYIDIQCVVNGVEGMGYTDKSNLKAITDYNVEKDIQFFNGEGKILRLVEGEFALFFPNDAHLPYIKQDRKIDQVKKIIFKLIV